MVAISAATGTFTGSASEFSFFCRKVTPATASRFAAIRYGSLVPAWRGSYDPSAQALSILKRRFRQDGRKSVPEIMEAETYSGVFAQLVPPQVMSVAGRVGSDGVGYSTGAGDCPAAVRQTA